MDERWNSKRAVVAGGTSGLGKEFALELGRRHAHLVLIARDRERLEQTRAQATAAGAASVECFALDAASLATAPDGERKRMAEFAAEHPIDLLVNAIGKSDRGRLGDLRAEDVVGHIATNVVSALEITRACWPGLIAARGCVVNIASLAGILAGPGLGAYPLSKHAMVAMHRQWRLEEASSGVRFLLVCPGPIVRDDAGDRYAELVAAKRLPAESARPGGGVRIARLDPRELCLRILRGVEREEMELVLPGKAKWLAALMFLWPSWADRLLKERFGG
jgi:short-subunit dehydrogenase